MYNVSSEFQTEILKSSRTVDGKVSIGGTTLTSTTLISFDVERNVGTDNMPTIGAINSSKLDVVLNKDGLIPTTLVGVPIIPYVGIYLPVAGIYEYVPLGMYYATGDDITQDKYTLTIECLDNISYLNNYDYESTLELPTTLDLVISEIAINYGIVFESIPIIASSVSITTYFTGTVREVLSKVAMIMGANLISNNDGKFEFLTKTDSSTFVTTLTGDNYFTYKNDSDSPTTIDQLIVESVDYDVADIVYPESTGGFAITLENENILDSATLQEVYGRANYPITYRGYTLTCQGMPHIECYDWLKLIDIDSNINYLLVGTHKIQYNGSVTSEFSIDVPKAESTVSVQNGGSTLQKAINALSNNLRGAITNATTLITGNQGGNVIYKLNALGQPIEIAVMDTDDIQTAQKVWRWNLAGFGYSSTGYDGTYGTAITQDGAIVADYITTGTLNADIVKAGTLQSVNGNSWIDMLDGTFNLSDKLEFDGTNLSLDLGFNQLITVESFDVVDENGVIDTSSFETLNTVWFTKNTGYYTGFKYDLQEMYQPLRRYVLRFFFQVNDGYINNLYLYNGKSLTFVSFKIDNVEQGDVIGVTNTACASVLNDGSEHYIEIEYTTPAVIPDDTSGNFTYIEFNRLTNDYFVGKFRGINLSPKTTTTNTLMLAGDSVIINSKNFQLSADGTIYANAGIFAGDINTLSSIYVGDEVFLNIANSANPKGLYFNSDKTRGIYANDTATLIGTINTQESFENGSLTLNYSGDFQLTGGVGVNGDSRIYSEDGNLYIDGDSVLVNGSILSETYVQRTMPATWSAGTVISITLPTGFTNENCYLVAVMAQQSNGIWYDLDRYDMFRKNQNNSIVATSSTISSYAGRPVRFILKRYI